MNGWIVAKTENWDDYENRRFIEEAQAQGLEMSLWDPKDLDICITERGQRGLSYQGQEISLPDFVLPRTGSGTIYYHLALIRHMECLGILVVNGSEAIARARDKLHTIQLLVYNGLPTPKTTLAKFPLDLEFITEQFQFPVIIKTVVGSRGRGVLLCENADQTEDLMEMLEVSGKGEAYHIIQEFVSSSKGQDLRVVVVGGKALGAMIRRAKGGNFKANISRGGSGEPYELNSQIEWLAIEATKALGLDIGGVDILFDGEGYKLCEVNSAPAFEGFERATGVNVPQQIYQYVRVRLNGHSAVQAPAGSGGEAN